MDNYNEKKLLNPRLFELLAKLPENLTLVEKKEIFVLSAFHFCTNYGNNLTNLIFREANNQESPIAQCGFVVDEGKFYHMITANFSKIKSFPIERIVLVACHECAHLLENDKLAQTIDFSSPEGINKYLAFVSKEDGDWYASEHELKADEVGYDISKNIYQRAVHDALEDELKFRFWESYSLLEYNESIEMDKHRARFDKK